NSALVRGDVLLLRVLRELLALGLQTVHQLSHRTAQEAVPLIPVRVIIRTDPLHRVHELRDPIDQLQNLRTRLSHALRNLATLLRIHTLERHDLPLPPPTWDRTTYERKEKRTLKIRKTPHAAAKHSATHGSRNHRTAAQPAAPSDRAHPRTRCHSDHGPHPSSRSSAHDPRSAGRYAAHPRRPAGSAAPSAPQTPGPCPSSSCPPS